MNRIFIDTEFNRLPYTDEWGQDMDPTRHLKLISIGLVGLREEDSLYIELADGWAENDCNAFTLDTVLPLLEQGDATKTTEDAQLAIAAWLNSFKAPVIVCDTLIDWLWLMRLLGSSWPAQLDPVEGCQLAQFNYSSQAEIFDQTYESYFDVILKPQHHALHDAKALRAGYLAAEAVIKHEKHRL